MSKSPPGAPSVNLLAVDTATEGCSAACLIGDKSFERYAVDPQGHSRTLLGMVEAVLAEARLERSALGALAYDAGPGSFTGIRIGAGVAQGLALGLEKPLLAVSSLMTLAEGARREQPGCNSVLAAIDARMDQVYWARLRSDPEAPG
ncbi:MAG TPA: tRNA (adenosine(37)-N6)-threonylcarbamoyltransferase complex dimerization subunit type 1 TsaB, partial [Gammaproteobacteria bacterium]|nr:tRNA (adenosine(37)-N6)-threonylcarbamoyltransferase complex dimerization subunit type 1 TsaB [Gammaproteobacteria bacterium]